MSTPAIFRTGASSQPKGSVSLLGLFSLLITIVLVLSGGGPVI